MEDPRFAHIANDPRFRPNIKTKKVKIDSRFKSVLEDKDFRVDFLDKRGRPINTATKEDLRKLYEYQSDEEDSDTGDEPNNEEEESEEDEVDDSESAEDFPEITEDGPDYTRGAAVLESSDEEEEGEEDEERVEEEDQQLLDHNWNEPDHDAPKAADISARLALCNMDWDRIKAKDLYMLFSSFVPEGGAVQSVTIYPSEMGRKRMAEEDRLGPREFREGEEGKDEGNMGKLDRARLRRYQLNRLSYYYAVIVCDSKETANNIYEECDSMEYEKSSCRIDLRFIPDDMTFDETPKDSCSGISDLQNFQPSVFTTTAFCQAKVHVTWDETNIERLSRTMKKKFTEEDLETDQFDDYIASEEESSDEKTSKKKKKKVKAYRKLLGLDQLDGGKSHKKKKAIDPFIGDWEEDELQVASVEKEKKKKRKEKSEELEQNMDSAEEEEEGEEDGEMQFTWEPDVKQQTSKKVKEKLSPWEEYQQKKRERKKQKKLERKREKLRQQGVEDTTDLGFDDDFFTSEPQEGKKKKKKDKKKKKKGDYEQEETVDQKEKAALELLMKGEEEGLGHFSLQKLQKESKGKKKGKKRKQAEVVNEDTFQMDLNDPRFAVLYTDPDMHIDPNAPEFKRTKGALALMEEVVKKRRTLHHTS